MNRALAVVLLVALLASALAGAGLFQNGLQAAENLQINPTKTQIQTVDSLLVPEESMKVSENGIRLNLVSPRQGSCYYDVVPLTAKATLTCPEELAFFNFYYSVDGALYGGERQVSPIFTTTLDLPRGEHRLRFGVDAITKSQKEFIDETGMSLFVGVPSGWVEVSFYVESYPISFFSLNVDVPKNSSSPQLVFSVSKSVAWTGYSVDGQDNVTVPTTTSPSLAWGNAALAGLSLGWHNVTVYATDLEGRNGISETITFKVTEPFPTALIAVSFVAIFAAITFGLLAYSIKKQKNKH